MVNPTLSLNPPGFKCPKNRAHALSARSEAPHQRYCRVSRVRFLLRSRKGMISLSETQQSPVIWRCVACRALVHPASDHTPVGWCPRCKRITEATRDGGSSDT